MNESNRRDCNWCSERIEPWLDEELSGEETARIVQHVAGCRECAAEVELARAVRATLQSLPEFECPPDLVEKAAMAAHPAPGWGRRFAGWLEPRMEVLLRPAMAAMVIVVVAVGVFVLVNHDRAPQVPAGYSTAEIEEAAREARIAFAYVGRYTRRPVRVLREDVIAERVAPAMEEALVESRREVFDRALVPAVEDAVLDALFVETTPRINRSKDKEGRPE